MKFNTKTRYGIRTMMEIGLKDNQGGVFQKEIAENQHISFKYLDHIISSLKTAGLITNVSGKKSGYKLTRDPGQITTYDIMKAFEPDLCVVDCLADHTTCKMEDNCATQNFWEGLNNTLIHYLKNYTLRELIEAQEKLNQKNAKTTS